MRLIRNEPRQEIRLSGLKQLLDLLRRHRLLKDHLPGTERALLFRILGVLTGVGHRELKHAAAAYRALADRGQC